MESKERLDYVNYILKNKDADYKGPNSLFKYRKFDKYTFDMLEKQYLFLSAAKRLDDKSECTTLLEINNLYNEEKDKITSVCIAKMLEMLKPVVKEEAFKEITAIVNRVSDKDGAVGSDSLAKLRSEIKVLNPNFDFDSLIGELGKIPDKLNNPEVNKKTKSMIDIARKARHKIGICALSEDQNNQDVWRRYGADSSGYCVEYDMVGFKPANILFPVVYENKREKDIIINFLGTFMSWVVIGISCNQIQPDVSQFIKMFITKSKRWKRQNEWRILGDADTKVEAPRIKRIIVGKNIAEENRIKMAEFCKRRNIPLEDQD